MLGWRYGAMEPHAFFRELFEIRRMIEPEASALAAERASAEEIGVIEKAFAVMAAAEADGPPRTRSWPISTSTAPSSSAAHNDLLLQMGKLIGVGLLVSYRISTGHYTLFLGRHKDVLTAIRKRRPETARRMMDRLLSETRDYLDTHLGPAMRKARGVIRTAC